MTWLIGINDLDQYLINNTLKIELEEDRKGQKKNRKSKTSCSIRIKNTFYTLKYPTLNSISDLNHQPDIHQSIKPIFDSKALQAFT